MRRGSGRERLRLTVKSGHDGGTTLAEDGKGRAIERQLRSVVIELLVMGEQLYRESKVSHHKWQVSRRNALIAEKRRQIEEAERKERERIAALEQARIDRLLGEAASLRNANDIRAYVDNVRAAAATIDPPVAGPELAEWTEWALAQAERIDPVRSRKFLEGIGARTAPGEDR